MAHAIIFMDRAPRTRPDDYTALHLGYPAGAYKIASVLRDMGLDVLVVPHCYNFTFVGIQQIINHNSANLQWVGVSNTFLSFESHSKSPADAYRQAWNTSKEPTIGTDFLIEKNNDSYHSGHQVLWETKEITKLGFFLEKKFGVPLLVGGMGRDFYKEDFNPANPLHRNVYFVKGYAESYVKQFTEQRLQDSKAVPPLFVNNTEYDDVDFKTSTINWNEVDMIKEYDWLPIETARGCAFNCAYCNYPRRSRFDSFKDPATLRAELIRNYEKFGVHRYNIIDDLYNDSKEKVRIFHNEVWSKLPFEVEWTANLRLDMIWSDPDSAAIIRDGGCRFGQFGIETLHPVAGRKVGKGLGKDKILQTLEFIKPIWGKQALVSGNFIAGLPFEPIESIQETMKWSTETDLLYSANWQPLFLDPPSKFDLQSVQPNKIEHEHDKFEVEWLNNQEWQNSVGVRFSEVARLCRNVTDFMPTKFKINIRNYIDLRTMGYSHDRIANIQQEPITDAELAVTEDWVRGEISQRLQTILATKI